MVTLSNTAIEGIESADDLTKQAAALPLNAHSLTRAVHCAATQEWRDNCSESLFKPLLGSTSPLPIPGADREDAVSVHQIRAGHWSRSLQ